jgi:dethiobiotin synthetase
MRGLFVTGTDTGVGKTILSAALVAAMSAAGEPVVAHKPVLTGLSEPPESAWPRDHELLGQLAGMSPEEVAPLRFGAPASPHLAAALEGAEIDPDELVANARAAGSDRDGIPPTVVLEGVGGLLVPLADGYTVRDLAAELELPIVIAARPGLGTINHTLLSLEAARAGGLRVAAVVLNPWPAEPGPLEASNLETIRRQGAIDVRTLPHLAPGERSALAAAGEELPWRQWLDGSSGDGSPLK